MKQDTATESKYWRLLCGLGIEADERRCVPFIRDATEGVPVFQLDRCDVCGVEGCVSGRLVGLCRSGDFIIARPWDHQLDEGDTNQRLRLPEHALAEMFADRCVHYVLLKDWLACAPSVGAEGYLMSFAASLPALTSGELISIVRWETAHQEVVWRHGGSVDNLLASSVAPRRESQQLFAAMEQRVRESVVALRPSEPGDVTITLFVDVEGTTVDWPIAVLRDSEWLLSPAAGVVAVPDHALAR